MTNWQEGLAKLETATARLEAAIPDNIPLAEEALAMRADAVAEIRALPPSPGSANRLRRLWERGEESVQRFRLMRAQLVVELSNVEQQRLLLRTIDDPVRSGQIDRRY
jgi:hypothetical protein